MPYRPSLEVSRYIDRVQRYDYLTREQETELFQRWFDRADYAARDRLVHAHLRYVVAVARKHRRYGVPLAELISAGNLGMMHALGKFDASRGVRFVTYAMYWVRAFILDHILDSWSLVRGSAALRSRTFFKLRRARAKVYSLVGEGTHADELIAHQLGISSSELGAMLRRVDERDVSLDVPVHADGSANLLDTLASPWQSQEEVLAHSQRDRWLGQAVHVAAEQLDPRERFIVQRRLMADHGDELSLTEIGRRLGVSRERARQLESRAKAKLRRRIGELAESADAFAA